MNENPENKLDDDDNEDENQEDETKEQNTPAEDELEKDNEEPEEQSDNLSFKDLWGGSSTFKIVAAAAAGGMLILVIGIIIALASLGSQSSNVDTQKTEATKWQGYYDNCSTYAQQQAATIADLQTKLSNASDTINALNTTLTNLTTSSANLTKWLNDAAPTIASLSFTRMLWEIGTGVAGVTSASGWIYGLVQRNGLGTCQTQITSLTSDLNTTKVKLRELTRTSIKDFCIFDSNKTRTSSYHCYDSAVSAFNKTTFRTYCAVNKPLWIEATNSLGVTFGIYISKNVNSNTYDYIEDQNSFMYIANKGTIAAVKVGTDPKALRLTADLSVMMEIGEMDVLISASTAQNTTATATISDTTTYNFGSDPNPYGSLSFVIASLNAYTISITRS